jgi:hypothetical protein
MWVLKELPVDSARSVPEEFAEGPAAELARDAPRDAQGFAALAEREAGRRASELEPAAAGSKE